MGKHGKRKSTPYEHVHTYNPKARESNERKLFNMQSLAIRRFQGYVDKVRETMRVYIPAEAVKKAKMDPMYELKGAARAAQEFYRPEGYEALPESRNLLEEYHGKMWEHEEGQKLLRAMLDLGLAFHNIGSKSKEAIRVFQESLEMDPEDHLVVRHRLLRCYLDAGDGLHARELLETMSTGVVKTSSSSSGSSKKSSKKENTKAAAVSSGVRDERSCCCYNRAFIEHISILLEEPDASESLRDSLLEEAYKQNPFTLWIIAHPSVFKEVLSRTTLLCDKEVLPSIPAGSLEDALVFYEADLPLWLQTDGVPEWITSYMHTHKLTPPSLSSSSSYIQRSIATTANTAAVLSAAANEGHQLTVTDLHDMYVDMFTTAFEIIQDSSSSSK